VQDRFVMSDAEINQFMRELSTEIILENPGYYLRGTAKMTWQLLLGEPERLSTDWKTQNARLSRDEWDDRIEHLLSRASTAQRNELDTASAVVALVQPPAWGPTMPVLFIIGSVIVVFSARYRPALLLSLSVLALLLTCAALDGPVVRYRYPADPMIALIAAGALTIGLPLLYRRLAALRSRPAVVTDRQGRQVPVNTPAATSAPATGPVSRGA